MTINQANAATMWVTIRSHVQQLCTRSKESYHSVVIVIIRAINIFSRPFYEAPVDSVMLFS